jgi:hypothetical protein
MVNSSWALDYVYPRQSQAVAAVELMRSLPVVVLHQESADVPLNLRQVWGNGESYEKNGEKLRWTRPMHLI